MKLFIGDVYMGLVASISETRPKVELTSSIDCKPSFGDHDYSIEMAPWYDYDNLTPLCCPPPIDSVIYCNDQWHYIGTNTSGKLVLESNNGEYHDVDLDEIKPLDWDRNKKKMDKWVEKQSNTLLGATYNKSTLETIYNDFIRNK